MGSGHYRSNCTYCVTGYGFKFPDTVNAGVVICPSCDAAWGCGQI